MSVLKLRPSRRLATTPYNEEEVVQDDYYLCKSLSSI